MVVDANYLKQALSARGTGPTGGESPRRDSRGEKRSERHDSTEIPRGGVDEEQGGNGATLDAGREYLQEGRSFVPEQLQRGSPSRTGGGGGEGVRVYTPRDQANIEGGSGGGNSKAGTINEGGQRPVASPRERRYPSSPSSRAHPDATKIKEVQNPVLTGGHKCYVYTIQLTKTTFGDLVPLLGLPAC